MARAPQIKPLPFPGESPTVALAMAAGQKYGLHEEKEKPARSTPKRRASSKSAAKPRKASKSRKGAKPARKAVPRRKRAASSQAR